MKEALKSPKLDLNIKLIYDILTIVIDKMDAWLIEHIVEFFYDKKLLKMKLGATGETLYDITEDFILENWNLFSDSFRHLYRHSIYED